MRAFIALISLVLLTGCEFKFGDDYTLDESTFDKKAIQTVARVSGLQLPDGVRGLDMAYYGSGIDDALIAKLEIPASDSQNIAKQIEAIIGRTASAGEALAQGKTWWNPETMIIKVHRQLEVNSDYLELILAKDGTKWFLFVKWLST